MAFSVEMPRRNQPRNSFIPNTIMSTSSRLPSASLENGQQNTAVEQKPTKAQTLQSTETADTLVQTEVADLSSGSHLLGHSPRCTASATFSPEFSNPREISTSVERPFLVQKSAEMRRISVVKSFSTEIIEGIHCLQKS